MHAHCRCCCEPAAGGPDKLKLAVTVLLLGGLLGCGKASQGVVSGKVTHKGKPVVHGEITFFRPGTDEVAVGTLGDEGIYTLQQPDPGLAVGEYKVMVAPLRIYQEVSGPEGKDVKIVLQGRKRIPVKYRQRDRTPLVATVTGGEDSFHFELKL